jgi:hypothetical protein
VCGNEKMVPSVRPQRKCPRVDKHPAQQKAQKSRKHLPSTVLQLARRTRSQQLAQNQAQVERSHMHQLPLQNVLPPPQTTSRRIGFWHAAVRLGGPYPCSPPSFFEGPDSSCRPTQEAMGPRFRIDVLYLDVGILSKEIRPADHADEAAERGAVRNRGALTRCGKTGPGSSLVG